jgi:hypothetical protein
MRPFSVSRLRVSASAALVTGLVSTGAGAQMPPLSPARGACPAEVVSETTLRVARGPQPAKATPAFPGAVFDQSMGSGENYAVADFRM